MLLEQQVVLSAKADTIGQKTFRGGKNRYISGKIALNDFSLGRMTRMLRGKIICKH